MAHEIPLDPVSMDYGLVSDWNLIISGFQFLTSYIVGFRFVIQGLEFFFEVLYGTTCW
jgi:hypothetical protein